MNEIEYTKQALKSTKRIPAKSLEKIVKAIRELENMPDCKNVRPIVNTSLRYRLKVGQYRVLFKWHDKIEIVTIEKVEKRNDNLYKR